MKLLLLLVVAILVSNGADGNYRTDRGIAGRGGRYYQSGGSNQDRDRGQGGGSRYTSGGRYTTGGSGQAGGGGSGGQGGGGGTHQSGSGGQGSGGRYTNGGSGQDGGGGTHQSGSGGQGSGGRYTSGGSGQGGGGGSGGQGGGSGTHQSGSGGQGSGGRYTSGGSGQGGGGGSGGQGGGSGTHQSGSGGQGSGGRYTSGGGAQGGGGRYTSGGSGGQGGGGRYTSGGSGGQGGGGRYTSGGSGGQGSGGRYTSGGQGGGGGRYTSSSGGQGGGGTYQSGSGGQGGGGGHYTNGGGGQGGGSYQSGSGGQGGGGRYTSGGQGGGGGGGSYQSGSGGQGGGGHYTSGGGGGQGGGGHYHSGGGGHGGGAGGGGYPGGSSGGQTGPKARLSGYNWNLGPYSVRGARPGEPIDVTLNLEVVPRGAANDISGDGLWKVNMFGSTDASGNMRYGQKSDLLTPSQASQPLRGSDPISFTVNTEYDVGSIGCTDINHLCVEFAKGDQPSTDYTFPISNGRPALVSCNPLECSYDQEPSSPSPNAEFSSVDFTASGTNRPAPPGLTNMDFGVNAGTTPQSENVHGSNLWKLGVFGSQNRQGTGPRRNQVPNVLDSAASSTSLVAGRRLQINSNANINVNGIGRGQNFPYMCMEFSKGRYAYPDFDLSFGGQPSTISCDEFEGPAVPEASVTDFSSSISIGRDKRDGTTPVTVRSDVTTSGNEEDIQGMNLWKLGLYGSDRLNGSGRLYPVQEQLLPPSEADKPLRRNRGLFFDVSNDVDLNNIGTGTDYPYICTKFGKHPLASPPYELQMGGQDSIISCTQLNREPREGPPVPEASVTNFQAGIALRTENPDGTTLTNVQANVETTGNDEPIEGVDLWQLGLIGSEQGDGQGRILPLVEQMLTPDQADQPLRPEATLNFDVSNNITLNQIGRGTDYPFICTKFNKHPAADPPFQLNIGGSDAIVTCTPLNREPQQAPTTNVVGYISGVELGRDNPDYTTPVTVRAEVLMSGNDRPISGTNLWQLGLLASQEPDGSGNQLPIADQLLPHWEAGKTLNPNEDLEFEVPANVNLNNVGRGTDYPYICAKFNKHPAAYPPYELRMAGQDAIIGCSELGREPVEAPTANLVDYDSRIGLGPDNDDATTPTTVAANVIMSGNDQPISGTNLWKLGLLGSHEPDGSGDLLPIVDQILPPSEASKTLYPNDDLVFEVTDNVDLNRVGRGTDYPYICTKFSKHPEANPPYNLRMGGQDAVIACAELSRAPVIVEPEDAPEVVVSAVIPEKRVPVAAGSPINEVTFDVNIEVDPDQSDDIEGEDLWELDVWTSKKKTGLGKKLGLVSQVLTEPQQDQPLDKDRPLSFPVSTNLNLKKTKCKDVAFLCAEIKKKQGSQPEFGFRGAEARSTVGCSPLTCKKYKKPKGVTLESIEPTPITVYEDQVNEITFDSTVTFDPANSKPITKGEKLWKVGAWVTNDPSSPRKIGEKVQVLTPDKRDKPIPSYRDPIVFENIPMTIDLTGVKCKKVKYLCNTFKLDKPKPKFTLTKKNKAAGMGCAPVTCKVPGQELPEVTVMGTITAPVTIYPNEITDVTTQTDVVFDTREPLDSEDNWEVSSWFSKLPDGSGPKKNPIESHLTQPEKDAPIDPELTISFPDITQQADLTDGSTCADYKYICSEIRKRNPNPDFELVEANQNARRDCAQVTCEERDVEPPTVEFNEATLTPVTLYLGEVNEVKTDVGVTFNEDTTDPDVAGEGLWQISTFFSNSPNGEGSSREYVKSALTDDQGAMPVNFENFVAEGLPLTADMSHKKSCNRYEYICASIRKDKPSPNYKLIGGRVLGCAPVTCTTRPDEPEEVPDLPENSDGQPIGPDGEPVGPDGRPIGPDGRPIGPDGEPTDPEDLPADDPNRQRPKKERRPKHLPKLPDSPYVEVIETTASPVVLRPGQDNDVATDVAVQFDTPDVIKGGNLWEMDTWFSKYPDGSGPRLNEKPKNLNQKQRDKPAKVDKDLSFSEIPQNVNLRDSPDYCQDYKYICAEIRKNRPNPDFALIGRFKDSKRGCAKVTCEVSPDGPPAVEFASVAPTPVTLYVGEKNKVTTDVAVGFNEETTDPTVAGEDLWQMTVWFSKSETGSGPAKGISKSALTAEQGQMPVDFDNFVAGGIPMVADLRDLISCNKYAYLCARVRKDKPKPDYRQIGKDKTGCVPVVCDKRDPIPEDPEEADPDAPKIEIVSTTTTPVTLFLDENNDVTTDVAVQFETDNKIEGTDLWEMSTWFSKNKDGSGKQTNLRENNLSERQRNKPVKPDKDLTYVDLPQNVDLTDGSGCGKYKFICSEIRKNSPSPNFKLKERSRYSRRGCAPVTCNERDVTEAPTVEFASVQPTPVTLYIGENNEVMTDVSVEFNQDTTDPSVAGNKLWQMSLWFSKGSDGQGSTKSLVKSALSDEQGQNPVDFDNFVMEDLQATADLTDLVACNKYKYICARVRKNKPSPDYEQIGKDKTGCAPVTCKKRDEEEPDEELEIIYTSTTPVTLFQNENNDVSTDVGIQFDAEYPISGTNLWEMSNWFSKYPDGSGEKYNPRSKTLTPRQKNKKLKPNKDMGFLEMDQNVDLTDGSSCKKYKYICSEIRKDRPNPNFKMTQRSRNSRRGCAKVTCNDQGEPETPLVQFQSVQPTPVELYLGERNKVETDVTVRFNEAITDPTVAGTELWQMALWFSKDSDGVGSSTGFVESALTDKQGTKPVDFDDFVMEELPMKVNLIDKTSCAKYKYICARVRKDKPNPNYKLIGKSRTAITGCAPVECKKRDAPEEEDPNKPFPPEPEPESIIEVVATTTTPVTLYLNEVTDVTTDVEVIFDTEATIQGSDLWEMSNWFSKQKDGSGKQTNLQTEVLSPRQRNKKVKPDKPLTYVDLPQSVDLTDGSGCGKYKYICSEIRKYQPNPDFELIDRKKFSRRGCAQVTCEERGADTPVVQFRRVQPTPVTLYVGENNEVTTDVSVKFKESVTDPTVAGETLWQMAVWFSKSGDGQGSSTGYVESALNEAQQAMPVDFDDFVTEELPMIVDLTDADGCGKYKFICARIRKDSPVPDYKLVGKTMESRTGCAPVTCETRDEEEQVFELVSTEPTPVTLYTNERNEVTTDVTSIFDNDYGVSGRDNWEIKLWYSKLKDGSGKETAKKEKTLSRRQRDMPLTIEGPLVFEELPSTVDLTDGSGCGKYKYLCAEIRKSNPDPRFDYSLKKRTSPRGCVKITCKDRAVETPTVMFQRVQPTPVTLVVGEVNDVTSDVSVEFNRDKTDPTVAGNDLWELTMWFSKKENGVGSSTGTLEETLTQAQKNMPVDFNDFEFRDMPMRVDLTDAIGCNKYKYICARIRKNDPEPDYELVGKNPTFTTGCAPVECEIREEPEPEPLIITRTEITPVQLYQGEVNTVSPDVTVMFEGEDDVTGSNLWEMTIYFTKNGDGSGKRTQEATATLTQAQKDQSLIITESLVFESIEKAADMTMVEGCGKFKYICAEIRKDSPSPPFEFKKKKPSSTRGCAKTSCEVREDEEPIVKFASTQPTAVTIYEEEVNTVNTDVVVTFDESETDPTVAGNDLWQMQLWFSKAENGQGSSIGTIESALSEEQANMPVSFSDFSFQALQATADLTTQGCGKYKYICARIRRDRPDPSYNLVGKDPTQTTGCAPVDCQRGRDPTVEFASVSTTPVTVYEESETAVQTTVSVTFNEDRTDESVAGSNLWQVDLWFSKAPDGAGSSTDGVKSVLTPAQASQGVNFNNFQFQDLEIVADLRQTGCGKYRYICAQIRRDDPDPKYKLLGKNRDATVGCAEVSCDRGTEPEVEFASVETTGVTVYEERQNPVTTTVSVRFNEATTDESVSGSNLWQVTLWFSKSATGQGSETGRVESALTGAQTGQPVSFRNFQFEDLEITADLRTVGCGKFRYICARIRRDNPEPSYTLLSRTLEQTSGCAEVQCERSSLESALVTSVSNTPVSISPEQNNDATTDVTVTFDSGETGSISGRNLWRVETWYSKSSDGAGFRSSLTDQALSSSQQSQAIDGSYTLQFNGASATADLRRTGCGKYKYVCARIKKGEADPDYDFRDQGVSSTTGCSPVTCGEPPQETPHITPRALTVSPSAGDFSVITGERNTLNLDISVDFDPSDTDDVSGSNLWKIIVWLSDNNDGVTGSRVQETEDTITSAQKDISLSAPGPLEIPGVVVDMNLSREKCKKISYVCARLKKNNPTPDYTMSPKAVSGCAPCACS